MARRILVLVSLCLFAAAPLSAQEPVRLGVLTIRSGPIASCGRQMEEGLQFALKERGGVLAGRKLEVFFGDYVRQTETPMVISPAAADDITQRKTNPWFVRATMSGSQVTHPLGEYAAKKLGYKRVATISDDFAYGHEHTAGFQRTFEENGGKIV